MAAGAGALPAAAARYRAGDEFGFLWDPIRAGPLSPPPGGGGVGSWHRTTGARIGSQHRTGAGSERHRTVPALGFVDPQVFCAAGLSGAKKTRTRNCF